MISNLSIDNQNKINKLRYETLLKFKNADFTCIKSPKLIKILQIPSFHDTIKRWEVYEDGSVFKAEWFVDEDLDKVYKSLEDHNEFDFASFCPKMIFKSSFIKQDIVEFIMNKISNITIPIKAKGHFGCDGETYEVEFGDYWANIKLSWWWSAPEEWELVGNLSNHVISTIDNTIKDVEGMYKPNFRGKVYFKANPVLKVTPGILKSLRVFSKMKHLDDEDIFNRINKERDFLLSTEFTYYDFKRERDTLINESIQIYFVDHRGEVYYE